MKVSESPICVAYHFKQKIHVIEWAVGRFTLDKVKQAIIVLANRAKKTSTQKRIKEDVLNCESFSELVGVVNRVIRNGDKTEFKDYTINY